MKKGKFIPAIATAATLTIITTMSGSAFAAPFVALTCMVPQHQPLVQRAPTDLASCGRNANEMWAYENRILSEMPCNNEGMRKTLKQMNDSVLTNALAMCNTIWNLPPLTGFPPMPPVKPPVLEILQPHQQQVIPNQNPNSFPQMAIVAPTSKPSSKPIYTGYITTSRPVR